KVDNMKITSPSYKEVSINNYRNLLKYTDKERSTALNLWEKFCDLFRSNKKKDVINTLYNLITPPKNENLNSDLKFKLHRFEQLKCLANPSHRDQFKIHVHSQETNKNKYTLSIKNNDVYSFIAENNWEPLSQIPFAQLPLIENYSSIVKNYAKDHQDSFNKRYPTTKITAKLDADVLMDFSCFFLEKNPMLKNTLLGYGLTNIDIIEVTTNEMSKKWRVMIKK
ncbi:hypothetical protein ACKE2E_09245, partial [Yersinia enterocolitica]